MQFSVFWCIYRDQIVHLWKKPIGPMSRLLQQNLKFTVTKTKKIPYYTHAGPQTEGNNWGCCSRLEHLGGPKKDPEKCMLHIFVKLIMFYIGIINCDGQNPPKASILYFFYKI